MDRLIEQHLEGYLRGSLEPRQQAEFERRLEMADDYTRRTVAEFAAHGQLLRSAFQAGEQEPAPGFYGRVMQRIEAQRTGAWWSALLEPQFNRRLAYASLTLLLLLGVTMFTTEHPPAAVASTPAEVMALPASEPVFSPEFDQDQGRDLILVDLATYQGQ